MIPVYHAHGPRTCGQVAFLVKRRHPLQDYRAMPADNVVKVNGQRPQRGEWPICGSCRQMIRHFDYLSYEPGKTFREEHRPLILLTDTIETVTA